MVKNEGEQQKQSFRRPNLEVCVADGFCLCVGFQKVSKLLVIGQLKAQVATDTMREAFHLVINGFIALGGNESGCSIWQGGGHDTDTVTRLVGDNPHG